MTQTDEALQRAYARYDAASSGRDRQELVTARLALCLTLLERGWSAPEAVQEQIQRDRKTLLRLRDDRERDAIDLRDLPPQPAWSELRWLTSPAFSV